MNTGQVCALEKMVDLVVFLHVAAAILGKITDNAIIE